MLVYGTPANDSFCEIIRTLDGGWCMVGTTGGELNSQTDVYVVKTDNEFNCIWTLNVGDYGVEIAEDAVQRANGEIVIVGYSVNNSQNGYENYLIRISESGSIVNEVRWGDSEWNTLNKVTCDGQDNLYVIAESFNQTGSIVYSLNKIQSNGNQVWQENLNTNVKPKDLQFYQDKLYVLLQNDTVLNSNATVHQFEISGILSGVFNLTDSLAMVSGLAVNEFGVAVVGEHPNGVFRNPYTCVFNFDTSILLEQSFNYDFNMWYKALAPTTEGFSIIGGTSSFGLGMTDFVAHRTNASCQFINGGTIGSTKVDEVSDALVVNDTLVFVGQSNGYATGQQNQAVIYFNPSATLSNVDATAENMDCFFVGIAEDNLSESNENWIIDGNYFNWIGSEKLEYASIFDAMGRVVVGLKDENSMLLPSSAGLYFIHFRSEGESQVLKYLKY
jgi:hypothetical protein